MSRKNRVTLAIVLMACALVLNVVILATGDVSPGWPVAAMILLSVSAFTLLAERRGY